MFDLGLNFYQEIEIDDAQRQRRLLLKEHELELESVKLTLKDMTMNFEKKIKEMQSQFQKDIESK